MSSKNLLVRIQEAIDSGLDPDPVKLNLVLEMEDKILALRNNTGVQIKQTNSDKTHLASVVPSFPESKLDFNKKVTSNVPKKEIKDLSLNLRYTVGKDTFISVVAPMDDPKLIQAGITAGRTRDATFLLKSVIGTDIQKLALEKYAKENLSRSSEGNNSTKMPICIADVKFEHHNTGKRLTWVINSVSLKSIKIPTNKPIVLGEFNVDFLTKTDAFFSKEGFKNADLVQSRISELHHAQLNPTHTWLNKDGERGGKDFRNEIGLLIDCKSVSKSSNNLAIDEVCFINTANMADRYYLYEISIIADLYKAKFVGSISKEKILALHAAGNCNLMQGANGEYRVIPRNHLDK